MPVRPRRCRWFLGGFVLVIFLLALASCGVLASQDRDQTGSVPGTRLGSQNPDIHKTEADLHLKRAAEAIKAHALAEGEAELRLALQADPNLAEAHLMLAELELQKGQTVEAIRDFQRGLKLNPRSFHGHYNLALAYLHEGNRNEGVRELEQAARLDPGNADVAYNLGVLLLEMGKPEDALRHLRQAEAAEPGRPDVAFNLARALFQLGRTQEAREQIARDSTHLGGDSQWNASVGGLLLENNDSEEAIHYLRRSVELDANNVASREQLGAAYVRAGQPQEALNALANLNSSQSHFVRATAFLALHRLHAAEEEASRAVEMDPGNPRYLILAARIAQYERPQDRALELIRKAIEAAPNWSEACYSQAVSYYVERRYPEAQRSLDEALKLDARSARALFLYGITEVNVGHNRKAEEYLTRAISLEPSNATFHFHLGTAYLRENRISEARQAFEKAIQLRPSYALPHYQLAKLFIKQGQNEAAEKELQKAIDCQPDLAPAYYQLSRLLDETGQKEKAAQELATFNRLKKEFNDEDLLILEDATTALR